MSSDQDRAYLKALNLISYRPRSVFEIQTTLKRHQFANSVIESAITRLTDQDYLNDHRFALWFAQSRINHFRGPLIISRDLKTKGIEPSLINQVLSELLPDQDSVRNLAQKLLQKKHLNPTNPQISHKAAQYLARYGFPYSVISQILSSYIDETP